ncbi:hypothetical protein EVS84_10645 [Pseudomonas koreensis]|uniref:Uncharacterized protein n=1 Tax=Pseudomonas koreensis TaxID=198620 RepID=A0A4Q4LA56_9PSED|nr:hypothetical protein EVS84_10645 [Pseudomonas koreensis]
MTKPNVGASLLAKRPCQPPSMLTETAISRAGSLSHEKRFAMQPDNGGHPWPVNLCSACRWPRRR